MSQFWPISTIRDTERHARNLGGSELVVNFAETTLRPDCDIGQASPVAVAKLVSARTPRVVNFRCSHIEGTCKKENAGEEHRPDPEA